MKSLVLTLVCLGLVSCSSFNNQSSSNSKITRSVASHGQISCSELLKSIVRNEQPITRKVLDDLFSTIRDKGSPLSDTQLDEYIFSFYYPKGQVEWKKAEFGNKGREKL